MTRSKFIYLNLGVAMLATVCTATPTIAQTADRVEPAERMVAPRSDGATITVTSVTGPNNARTDCNGPRGCGGRSIVSSMNAQLPKSMTSYSLADLEDAAENAKGSNQRIGVKICWQGKRRPWCLSLSSD